MEQNHRRHLRKVPDSFTFIQIERDEVGKVLNVSEGGLSFSSLTPVVRNMPVYFWVSFNLKDRIEAMGEVKWTDATRKIGGLRFTQLSQAGREQMRSWLSRLAAEQPFNDKAVPCSTSKSEPIQIRTKQPDRVARFVAKARAHVLPLSLLAAAEPADVMVSPPLRDVASSVELVPLQRYLSAKKRQLLSGVLLGICVSAGAVAFATKYHGYSLPTRDSVPMPAASSPSLNVPTAQPAAPRVAGLPRSSGENVFSSGESGRPRLSKPANTKPVAAAYAYVPALSHAGGTDAAKPSPDIPTQPRLSGTKGQAKKQVPPAQLWAAVQGGNSNAAVELAELYIKGDGVPQNCQQARVLLLVASEKRNTAAIKRLQELDKNGSACP